MKKYKVLTKDLKSPFQDFQYEIGKEYICEDFDESDKECSSGFYATDLEGLAYSLNGKKGNRVFEVEVGGKQRIFNQFKQRFEKQTIIKEVPISEIKKLVKKVDCSYDLYHALFPVNPLRGKPKKVTKKEIELLKKWASVLASVRASVRASVLDSVGDSVGASVRDSVGDSVLDSVRDSVLDSVWASVRDSVGASVWDSVRDSVWDSVWASVWDSVGDSVWDSLWYSVRDSVWAYVGSLFPRIKKWKYIEHEEGVYPFQLAVDLWHSGFVPSSDGKTWRLHSGKHAEIVYELTK